MRDLLYIANLRLPTEKAYGIQITKMCEAFADSGLAVDLAIPTRISRIKSNVFDYYDVKRNFQVVKLFSLDFYLPGKLDAIAFMIKNFLSSLAFLVYSLLRRAEIVFSRDELPIYLLSFFRKNLFFEAHKFSKTKFIFYRRFKKAGFKIITISGGLKKEFVQFGFPADHILVAPDGVDLHFFDIAISKQEARARMGLPEGKNIVIYTGHLLGWKGVDTLARAARALEDYLIVLVGGTDRDIEKFRQEYGEDKNILIIGQRPHSEIPIFLKAADVLVLPNNKNQRISEIYTSPLKLFEYMASGRPIIASDLPSLKEVLNEGNSLMVEPGDDSSLAKGIRMLVEDRNLSDRISKNALEDVGSYTWHKRAQKILHFIQ